MESERFDRLAKMASVAASRRSALLGLARGVTGGALGLLGLSVLTDDTVVAKKKKQCNGDAQCKNPNNPCKKANCKRGKCRKKNERNGKSCGGGNVCLNGRCVADCDGTGSTCTAGDSCCSGVCTCGPNDEGGLCQGDFSQGFEQNSNGWIGVERVASGTDGIPARSGGFFGKVDGPASSTTGFTRWGGYSSVFPEDGYDTETAIYIDPANSTAGLQFDYSSAANQPDCNHRRDFIFTAGKVGADYCVSASNNSPGDPCNSQRDPQVLTAAGWYVFRHEFRNVGGVLSVDLVLIDPEGDEVNTWTLSDPSDVIGTTVGGNRYGWFPNNEFEFVAIDDTSRSTP